MEVWKEIEDYLKRCGIKRNRDVLQLHLTKIELTSVPDLSRFHFIRRLWLNNNKIKELSCHTVNCCLTELYLHNNSIKSISGALRHLTCLQVLLLHNNQIRGLEDTVNELRRMQQLHTATFFLNHFSQEPEYRHYVIHSLPSVQLLDRKEVKPEERRQAFQMYNAEHHRVLQTLAFSRRTTFPTRNDDHVANESPSRPRQPSLRRSGRSKMLLEESTHPGAKRTIMQFSILDWEAVREAKQQQLCGEGTPPPGPRILTVTL